MAGSFEPAKCGLQAAELSPRDRQCRPLKNCQILDYQQWIEHAEFCTSAGPRGQGLPKFFSLAEGKAVCILEAPDKESVAAWFQKMGMPTDSVTALELEGERGSRPASPNFYLDPATRPAA